MMLHTLIGGNGWRMPTIEEFEELVNYCEMKMVTQNGIKGCLVSNNNNSIFLPAADFRGNGNNTDVGSYCYYWTSTLYLRNTYCAWGFHIGSYLKEPNLLYSSRFYGSNVRAVVNQASVISSISIKKEETIIYDLYGNIQKTLVPGLNIIKSKDVHKKKVLLR